MKTKQAKTVEINKEFFERKNTWLTELLERAKKEKESRE